MIAKKNLYYSSPSLIESLHLPGSTILEKLTRPLELCRQTRTEPREVEKEWVGGKKKRRRRGRRARERIKHSGPVRYWWIMHNQGNGPLRRFKSHKCIARLFPRTRTVLSGHSPASRSCILFGDSRRRAAETRGRGLSPANSHVRAHERGKGWGGEGR